MDFCYCIYFNKNSIQFNIFYTILDTIMSSMTISLSWNIQYFINFGCLHPIFKITKFPIYFFITNLFRHVGDSIKATRFIKYILTLLHVQITMQDGIKTTTRTPPNKMFFELCVNNTSDFQNKHEPLSHHPELVC